MRVPERHLLLYDGVCGLCNRLTRFVLRRDRRGRFRFATLQGALGREILAAHGRSACALDTFFVVAGYGSPHERVLERSAAALFVAGELGWPWRAAAPLRRLPAPLLDRVYEFIARHRYRWFGRRDRCPVPPPEQRERFLDP